LNALRALEPFARAWRALTPAPDERCQLCAAPLADDEEHPHLVDLDARALLCACATCAGVFALPGAGGERSDGNPARVPGLSRDDSARQSRATSTRYRLVPSRVLVDADFVLPDARWEALRIPVRLAFIFFNSRAGRWVALYPSPAGAAESELGLEAFRELAAATPLLDAVEPDVEALLVYGRRGRPFETFLVSIDACYRLVGRVRLHWQGFHGGDAAWREIEGFFADLRARARPVEGAAAGQEGNA